MDRCTGAGVARRCAGPVSTAVMIVSILALVALGAVAPTPARGQTQAPPGPANQLVSVVLAKGIQSSNLFGQGDVTPVEPTTTFVNTDLPYAIVKVKSLEADTVITLKVSAPSGPAFAIEVKAPQHKDKPWESFDFALPLYILGTDLETRTGTWNLQVLFNGQPVNTTAFQWQSSSPIQLGKIRDKLNLDPTSPDLHWRYGAALVLLKHEREGEAELQNAIKLDPRYALYYISLGRVYERLGRHDDAIKMYKSALSQRGSYYDAVYSAWAQAHLAKLQGR
jgi:Tetratricopeptide repeat